MHIRWTTPAAKALLAIQEYIARENPRAAFEVGIPYIVPYRLRGKEVQVLSVYHTSRKWPESFE